MEIVRLDKLMPSNPEEARGNSAIISRALDSIFFETSVRKQFASEEERSEFRYRYLDLYLMTPEWVWVLVDSLSTPLQPHSVMGYLVAAPSTTEEHFLQVPALESFREEIISTYPAHLHINLTERARGNQTGSKMLSVLELELSDRGIRGVHLVTGARSRNVSFYQKNGYVFVKEVLYQSVPMVMLGKRIS
jgi:GNAT superfamily N-acetyltransferase